MDSSIPLSLIISWILFFSFINITQRHAKHFEDRSRYYFLFFNVSAILCSLVGLGLLVYCLIHLSWCWPIVIFVGGSMVGGFFFGFFDVKIGLLTMSLVSFIGWPVSAIWVFFIIRDLHPLP
jgi:hypothetical protein